MTSVRFWIQGKITSANRVTRHAAFLVENERGEQKATARAYKPGDTKAEMRKIAGLALVAKMQQDWRVPQTAHLIVRAYNSRLDVGNIEKIIGDSIRKRLLIIDDRRKHLESLYVKHMPKDHLGERYEVIVHADPELPYL